jgi:hypothetical protein
MFRYAFLRLFAERRQLLWSFSDLRGHLRALFPDLSMGTTSAPETAPWYLVEDTANVDALLESGKWAWVGYFQDAAAFETIYEGRDCILGWYTQSAEAREKAKVFWAERKGVCCVNVRGGDFLPRGVGIGPEWYARAFDFARSRLGSSVAFQAVTDDPAYARKVLGPDVPIYHESPAYDFALLTEAPAIIQSNSTFCWWASFLNSTRLVVTPTGKGKMWHTFSRAAGRMGWSLL